MKSVIKSLGVAAGVKTWNEGIKPEKMNSEPCCAQQSKAIQNL